jgi:hypothetical protein
MLPSPTDPVSCWLHYLKIFAVQTPMGLPVKITVAVTKYDGERIARQWGMEPRDVVDAYGRAAKQVETDDHLIAVEWLTPKEGPKEAPRPFTWGGQTAWPKR